MRIAPLIFVALVLSASSDTPAVFKSGKLPVLSVASAEVGGGQVLLEASIDRTGSVGAIKTLRETPAFTERMLQAVRTWTFEPAKAEIPASRRKPDGPTTEAVDSAVLIAGVFRPPAVIGATLGEQPRQIAAASAAVPFPTSIETPAYPPGTMSPGVVLVEVEIDAKGGVTRAAVRIPSAGFNDAALSTARQWKFTPAKIGGVAAPAVAYIVFGFPVPKG